MKQEMRRTRKASEVRPALDEMADFNGQAGGPASLLFAAARAEHGSKRRASRYNPEGAVSLWRFNIQTLLMKWETGRSPTPRLLGVPTNCTKLGGDGKATTCRTGCERSKSFREVSV